MPQQSNIRVIDIFTQWTGFAQPPQRAAKLTVTREREGQFRCVDNLTGEATLIAAHSVDALINELRRDVPSIVPSMFKVSQAVVKSHFGSRSSGDSPAMLVAVGFDDGVSIRCLSDSQHAFLLPFTILSYDSTRRQSFNRGLSEAIADVMPAEFLLKERLLNGDAELLDTEESMRQFEELRRERLQQPDEPTLSLDELQARLDDVISNRESAEQRASAERSGDVSVRLLRRISLEDVVDVLRRGADPSISDEHGQTALMLAAAPPFDRERFRLLVEAGANLEARRTDGMTGLQLACAGGMAVAAGEWIRAGADVNARTPHGSTPLMFAVGSGKIVRHLLDAGAHVNAVDRDGHSAIVDLIEKQQSLRVLPQLESLDLLVEAGIDLDRQDTSGMTPRDHAHRAVRRREIEQEVQNVIDEAQHGEIRPRQSNAAVRQAFGPESDEDLQGMYDTDYDNLQLAEVIRDRLNSHIA